jgi:hypothetical protein
MLELLILLILVSTFKLSGWFIVAGFLIWVLRGLLGDNHFNRLNAMHTSTSILLSERIDDLKKAIESLEEKINEK